MAINRRIDFRIRFHSYFVPTGKRGTDQCLLRSAIPGKIGWIYAERERIVLHFAVLEIFNGRVQFPSGAVKGDRASHWKRFNIQILNNVTVFTISVSNDRGLSLSLFEQRK